MDRLQPSLQRLDRLLARAVDAAREAFGPEAAADRYRGLYVGEEEVDRLISRTPGESPLELERDAGLAEGPQIDQLRQWFGVTGFDLDVLLIALGPEVDLKYERLYGYLQDDVTRKRPTVDLILNLLCDSSQEKLTRRRHFGADAPLVAGRLVHLLPEPSNAHAPLLAHGLKVDDQIVRFLAGDDALDARLAPFCTVDSARVGDPPDHSSWLADYPGLLDQIAEAPGLVRLYCTGPLASSEVEGVARELAGEANRELLSADLRHLTAQDTDVSSLFRVLFREARLRRAVLCLGHLDAIRTMERPLGFEALLRELAGHGDPVVMAGSQPWAPVPGHQVAVLEHRQSIPDGPTRLASWQTQLAAVGLGAGDEDLERLSSRFALTHQQIARAVLTARARLGASGDERTEWEVSRALLAGARAQCGHDLAKLTRRVQPSYAWDDLVLPEDALAQLREICNRVTQRDRVFTEWGFGERLSLGKGVTVLFSGPSGTGKTMAAEVMANELGVDLYQIDLSAVVSKYIGETEKNLDRVFTAAEAANAILFFDEADALFGKRSEVRDSHDRYANVEISYLLMKMDSYENGVALLATNLRGNMDEAFVRRLGFTVHFPFPDEPSRQRIWERVWPREVPLAEDVDLGKLAGEYRLPGGSIRNVALAAAFQAAGNGGVVTMQHVREAVRREYQKMGKGIPQAASSDVFVPIG